MLNSARLYERPSPQLNFIGHDTEAMLISEIQAAMKDIKPVDVMGYQGRSRVLRFGWDYKDVTKWLGEFPTWLAALAPKLQPCDSITINEYAPGSEISAHTDSLAFSDPICILSLKSAATMDFKRKCCAMPFSVLLPPRSLLVLTGDYRYSWTHAVRAVKDLRYSIVFRKRKC